MHEVPLLALLPPINKQRVFWRAIGSPSLVLIVLKERSLAFCEKNTGTFSNIKAASCRPPCLLPADSVPSLTRSPTYWDNNWKGKKHNRHPTVNVLLSYGIGDSIFCFSMVSRWAYSDLFRWSSLIKFNRDLNTLQLVSKYRELIEIICDIILKKHKVVVNRLGEWGWLKQGWNLYQVRPYE